MEDNLMDCVDLMWFWSLKMILVVAETMMNCKGIMVCFWECIWQLRWNVTLCSLVEINHILEGCTSLSCPPHLSDGVSILPQNIGMFVPDLGITPQKMVNCHNQLCEDFRWWLGSSDFVVWLAIVWGRKDVYHRPLNLNGAHIKLEQGCLWKSVNN